MKFSENWLRETVAIEATHEALTERLSAIGLEVENVETLGAHLDGVVVAQIVSCAKHPEADRLQVCSVDIGTEERLQIVCGAPNARPGLKAPLALVDAVLPNGMQIKPATLRGVESNGMLCSAKELGIDPDASGLLELPDDAPVGAALAGYLGLPDASIELKLTPNRADCFSVRGIAFDVAAAFGSSVHPLTIEPLPVASDAQVAVVLDSGKDCPRYCGRVIEGVNATAPTPLWMRERLKRSGIRPISLLVDVTAYVMLEVGQPMHAYDAGKLEGSIRVRRGLEGETVKLLDQREVAIDPGFVVIADAHGSVGLAGVMGGWESRVTDATTNVFLEAAHFAPDAIVGRSRKLGMHTDAAHRFERGVDPELPPRAIERATALIVSIAGGQAGPVVEARLDGFASLRPVVTLRRDRLARVLGTHVADAEIERILRALGMRVETIPEGPVRYGEELSGQQDVSAWRVSPPSSRFDIAIEEDLIEEIARIHGYDAIPTTMPSGEIRVAAISETRVPESDVRRQLAARDYREAINYAFVDAALLATWSLDADAVALANPLSSDLGAMRTALLPGLVRALQHNAARQHPRIRLFEVGKVFRAASKEKNTQAPAPVETLRIAAACNGNASAEQWGEAPRAVDFYDVKADLESVAALAGIDGLRYLPATEAWLHPGRSAEVWRGDVRVGWIGHLHPRLLKSLDLDSEVLVFELDLEPLAARAIPAATALSRYPLVRRDLALVVPDSVSWAAVESSLTSALGVLLREVRLFDVYRGAGLDPDTRSVAMGLILQDVSRTLTDHDADRAMADAVAALERDCGAVLRGG